MIAYELYNLVRILTHHIIIIIIDKKVSYNLYLKKTYAQNTIVVHNNIYHTIENII